LSKATDVSVRRYYGQMNWLKHSQGIRRRGRV